MNQQENTRIYLKFEDFREIFEIYQELQFPKDVEAYFLEELKSLDFRRWRNELEEVYYY